MAGRRLSPETIATEAAAIQVTSEDAEEALQKAMIEEAMIEDATSLLRLKDLQNGTHPLHMEHFKYLQEEQPTMGPALISTFMAYAPIGAGTIDANRRNHSGFPQTP